MRLYVIAFLVIMALSACERVDNVPASELVEVAPTTATISPISTIDTKTTTPGQLISYAKSLTGIPYKYGSIDPREGFDCSGFVTFVFNHFGIVVPRQSISFTEVKQPIDLKNAKPGDLILFTGTDSTIKVVGHMGIITTVVGDSLVFIHSTSGKAHGVTETPLNAYYQSRYMKTIRIFPQNVGGN